MLLFWLACSTASPPDTAPDSPDTIASLDTDAAPDTGSNDTTEVPPRPLLIEHIRVVGDDIGEATLIEGPDGIRVLIDVGGASHTADVLEAIAHHLDEAVVDWIILTHWHRDHVGGLESLLEHVEVREGIISRGMFDISRQSAHIDETMSACSAIESHGVPHISLCSGAAEAPCDLSGKPPWPASRCDALPLVIPLGDGAAISLVYANGWLSSERTAVELAYSSGAHENARSIAGLLAYGDFHYLFGGDIAGGRGGLPDVETVLVENITTLPENGLDILHVNHHGHDSASNETWLSWSFPMDGQVRNAIISANPHYGGAVSQAVLDRLRVHLLPEQIWITEDGMAPTQPDGENIVDASVLVTVQPGGAAYQIAARDAQGTSMERSFDSTR